MPGMRSGPTASRSSSRRAQREALVDHALHSLPCPAAPLSPAPLLGARSPFGTVARAASRGTASVAIALRGDKLYSDETIELARGEKNRAWILLLRTTQATRTKVCSVSRGC